MIPPLLLALLMPISYAFAAGANAPTESDAPAAVAAKKTHPDLVFLEKDLTRAQDEKKEGKLTPERYSEWEMDFRSRLSAAMERIPPSPVNQAAHARVMALLGERKEAHAALDQALEESVFRGQQGAARGGRRARRRVRGGRQQVPQRIGGRLGRGGRETWFMAVSVRLVPGFKRFTRTL